MERLLQHSIDLCHGQSPADALNRYMFDGGNIVRHDDRVGKQPGLVANRCVEHNRDMARVIGAEYSLNHLQRFLNSD
jgi:hypothetical protein